MASPDWKDQYRSALDARDALEQTHRPLYDRITALSDRNAALQALLHEYDSSAATKPLDEESVPSVPPPLVGYGWRRPLSSPVQASGAPSKETAATLEMRVEFSKAQQDRVDLQAKFEALTKAHVEVTAHVSQLNQQLQTHATRERQLITRLRDREEELRGKSKLLADVQDENVVLDLELTVAEKQIQTLKKENQELVDRWMARMGEEAEKMNEAGQFQ